MKKKLIILTTHFGDNFSGGSKATCEVFSRVEDQFDEIVVIGTKIGNHPFKSLRFVRYNSLYHAIDIIKQENVNAICYGDFYNSYLFVLAKTPFYFTYHDNWPELGNSSLANRIRSLFYTNIYKFIFKKAISVITVSDFKFDFVKKYNLKPRLIYNGFNRVSSERDLDYTNSRNKVLMVGNIDHRKYSLALSLFKKLGVNKITQVHVYGNIVDHKIANKLAKYTYVSLKGFESDIPYKNYKFLLHTSFSESFGMVFCEAIYSGIPILTFDTGGASELISANQGLLIAPYNLEQMASTFQDLLNGDFSFKESTLDQYSWDKASIHYIQNFRQCGSL